MKAQEIEDMGFYMTYLSKERTQLPVIIWVFAGARLIHEMPHLKFQDSTSEKYSIRNLVSISISKEPELLNFDESHLNISADELRTLKNWIRYHHDSLMDHWDLKADSIKFIHSLNCNPNDWNGNR